MNTPRIIQLPFKHRALFRTGDAAPRWVTYTLQHDGVVIIEEVFCGDVQLSPWLRPTVLRYPDGTEAWEGDVIKFHRKTSFHSDQLNDWKEEYGLASVNEVPSLWPGGVLVIDELTGLWLKHRSCAYREPLFSHRGGSSWDWSTAVCLGNIYTNPELTLA